LSPTTPDCTTAHRVDKKAVPFHWEEDQTKAFETLKLKCAHDQSYDNRLLQTILSSPRTPSAYGVGAVLSQEGELNPRTKKPTQHPIAYYSSTFTPTERNYDIYELELLAIIKSLHHWRPHLAGTEEPVTVLQTTPTSPTGKNHGKSTAG